MGKTITTDGVAREFFAGNISSCNRIMTITCFGTGEGVMERGALRGVRKLVESNFRADLLLQISL